MNLWIPHHPGFLLLELGYFSFEIIDQLLLPIY